MFDGHCVLCNTFCTFLLKRLVDQEDVLFVPSQPPELAKCENATCPRPLRNVNSRKIAREYNLELADLSVSMHVIDDGVVRKGADAVSSLLRCCQAPYPIIYPVVELMPAPLKQGIYGFVSRNRHRWFGTQEEIKDPNKMKRGAKSTDEDVAHSV